MSTIPFQWHYDYTRIAWDTGFCFESYKSQQTFDRNGIALLDIDRIIRERDVVSVDHHIQNILEYKLDVEETNILNSNFVKLFRLSQLAVEYLIYCKKYLDTTVEGIKKDFEKSNHENNELKREILNYQSQLSKLKKKNKELKLIIQIHQKYQPGGSMNDATDIFNCDKCNKIFINEEYLKSHIVRRHPLVESVHALETKLIEIVNLDPQNNMLPIHSQYKIETDKLHTEIKEIKEKLNNTERYFKNDDQKENNNPPNVEQTHSEEYSKHIELLHQRFDLFKNQLESDMKNLKIERDTYDKLIQIIVDKIDTKQDNRDALKEKDVQETVRMDENKSNQENVAKLELPNIIEVIHEEPKENIVEETKEEVDSSVTDLKPLEHKSSVLQDVTEQVSESRNSLTDISKVKEEVEKVLEEKTKQDIKKLGEQLSEQMSNTYSQLHERFDMFWNKIQEMEQREKQQHITNTKTMVNMNDISKSTEDIIANYKTVPEKQQLIPKTTVNINDLSKTTDDIIATYKTVQSPRQSTDLDSDTETSSVQKLPVKQIKTVANVPFIKNDKLQKAYVSELERKMLERNLAQKTITKTKKSIVPKIIKPKEETSSETESDDSTESESKTVNIKPVKIMSGPVPIKEQSDSFRKTKTSNIDQSPPKRRAKSLETMLPSHPEVLQNYRDEMEESVSNRLIELGIDPEWTRLPEKTYKLKSDIVAQHRSMTTKKLPFFIDIRKNVIDDLEDKIQNLNQRESANVTPETQSRRSKLKSLFTNMKNKAKFMIKPEKPNTPTTAVYKLTIDKGSTDFPNTKKIEKKTNKKRTLYITDSDSDSEMVQSKQITQKHKVELRKIKSESYMDLSDKQRNSPSTSSFNAGSLPILDTLDLDETLSRTFSNSSDYIQSSKEDVMIKVSPRTRIQENESKNKTVQIEKFSSEYSSSDFDDFVEDKVQKGVLKNMSTSNLVKKKVLFDLHSSDSKTIPAPNQV